MVIDNENYLAEAVDPVSLGIERDGENETYLTVTDAGGAVFSARSYALLHVVLGEAKDVLYLPDAAVREANGRVFVYVLEDGVRVIRDIAIGFRGSSQTEIVSGLNLGDQVIIE
jgi:multidrug efflux pump subunit AcrA (membrane-fusion protein)